MNTTVIMVIGLFVLATFSGMLGLGVAFAAVPFLSLFLPDLVHQVQPLSLLLNGITATFAAAGFARSGLVQWKHALPMALVTTLAAPVGALLAQIIPQIYIWYMYFAGVAYLAYRLFKPVKGTGGQPQLKLALIFAVPISVVSGLLGVGPGFLLLPTLILLKYEPKAAAAITAVAVTPPSFSALIPHLPSAHWNLPLTVALLIAGAAGSFIGARITSLWVPASWLKRMFGVLIVVMTAYKIYTLMK
jgi:uncharacterized membrane protein YfcA